MLLRFARLRDPDIAQYNPVNEHPYGDSLSHKNALSIPIHTLPPIGLWQEAKSTHFPCYAATMATPNPAPIRPWVSIVSELQMRYLFH